MAGKVVKQLAGSGSGQSLMDRVTAAKHSLAGSGLARAVCKATTEEMAAPKKKHLQYLIECTNESNVSIPELVLELIERMKFPNWVVVFKALVSMHNLMNHGSERLTQYLASNNCDFALQSFSDKTTPQGTEMSKFITRYGNYIQQKAVTYRLMAFDFCKIKRGCDDAVMRTMPVEKILKAVDVLIHQFDALLDFNATANDCTNGVINSACLILYRDASRLFVVFNDSIINLLTKFFKSMNKKQCREALEVYKKFLVRSDRLNEFSKIAEFVGIDKSDITHLDKHPSSFLYAMEAHLAQLEGREYTPPDPSEEEEQQQQQQQQQRQPPSRPSGGPPRPPVPAASSASSAGPPRPSAPPSASGGAPPRKPEPPRVARTPERPAPPSLPTSGAAAAAAQETQHQQQQQEQELQKQQEEQQPANSTDILAAFMANQVTAIASAQQSAGFDPFDNLLQNTSSQSGSNNESGKLSEMTSGMSLQSGNNAAATAADAGNSNAAVNQVNSSSYDPFGNL